jgi:hypothetical protein
MEQAVSTDDADESMYYLSIHLADQPDCELAAFLLFEDAYEADPEDDGDVLAASWNRGQNTRVELWLVDWTAAGAAARGVSDEETLATLVELTSALDVNDLIASATVPVVDENGAATGTDAEATVYLADPDETNAAEEGTEGDGTGEAA